MAALLRVIMQIALLRQGPQVLPASATLLWLVLGAHWLTGVVLALFNLPLDRALFSSLVGTLVMLAVVQTLLLLHRLQSRFTQTLTALAACEVLLGLIAVPLGAGFAMGGDAQAIVGLLSLFLLGWNVAIAAHVFRHALDVSMGMGFLFSLGYTMVSISLASFIAPVQG